VSTWRAPTSSRPQFYVEIKSSEEVPSMLFFDGKCFFPFPSVNNILVIKINIFITLSGIQREAVFAFCFLPICSLLF